MRKRFARNPYTVTNVRDVLECDSLDVQAYTKYNDNYTYILSAINLFSKFLFLFPVKTKSGLAFTTAFLSIFDDDPKNLRGGPYEYARIRARNFLIKIFRTCYGTRPFSFRCLGIPTGNVVSWNLRIARFVTDYTNISRIKTLSDISTFCRKVSGPIMARLTRRQVWRPREWRCAVTVGVQELIE